GGGIEVPDERPQGRGAEGHRRADGDRVDRLALIPPAARRPGGPAVLGCRDMAIAATRRFGAMLLVAAVALSACGGGTTKVSPQTFVKDMCSALHTWGNALNRRVSQ